MRRTALCIALCLAAALGACRTTAPRPKPEPEPESAQACADWRWIGISRPGASCPAPPTGWRRQALFPELKPPGYDERKIPAPEVIQELQRFCAYETEDPRRGEADLREIAQNLERLDRDCAALSIAAEPDLEAQAARLRDEIFPAQTGLRAPFKVLNEKGVRLAFLDTHPTGEGAPETQGDAPLHGFTLARMAQSMVCPEGRCAALITTRLALSIRDFDPRQRGGQVDTARGGFIGLQGDLARAIQDEVDAWQRNRSQQRHLVLNLSLGWDGRLFDGLEKEQIREMRAGTQAVYRALQYAVGYDALVLAAAGNQKREPCRNDGPLLPAAWEEAKVGPQLVYAVGGVTSDGKLLVNTRPRGMPRRAAFGVLPSQDGEAILVGTSVATAVVSSIAAVVWDSFPELESRQVMEILDRSGKELEDRTADFWFGQSTEAPAIHWLSLCTALKNACEGRSPCPLQSSFCPAVAPTEDTTAQLLANPEAKGSCQPWVTPQPEDDPCPVCPPKGN